MQTEWDYTELAETYLKRPDYSDQAINRMFEVSRTIPPAKICDVGAGVAHLTLMLAARHFTVTAIEPNDAMRSYGMQRTQHLTNVIWYEGVGENTKQPNQTFDFVTFGSSFNVMDQERALKEVKRITKPKGWFACLWNHRDLQDPIQKKIEMIIKSHIANYSYGARREDQAHLIEKSGFFNEVIKIEGSITHEQSISDVVNAWRSHATLHRQAGNTFSTIINEIQSYLQEVKSQCIKIPYITRLWMAQLKD